MLRGKSFTLILVLLLAALSGEGIASESKWAHLVEFRDTVRPDTVPEALARRGEIAIKPWKDEEKSRLLRHIGVIVKLAPGFLERGASQGPIPLYRIDEKACRTCQKGASYGGHGALWFNNVFGERNRNYLNIESSLYTFVHELTHVVDAEHKIARSREFTSLVEPRIKQLRRQMKKNNWDQVTAHRSKRYDVAYDIGLPSFYAASTIQETLAELVAVTLLYKKFSPPADINRFLRDKVFSKPSKPDPSIKPYRRGKIYRLERKVASGLELMTQAIAIDGNFAEAYLERGNLYASSRALKRATSDYSRALELMSEFDWQRDVVYLKRAISFGNMGEYQKAVADLKQAKRLAPWRAKKINQRILLFEKILTGVKQ